MNLSKVHSQSFEQRMSLFTLEWKIANVYAAACPGEKVLIDIIIIVTIIVDLRLMNN